MTARQKPVVGQKLWVLNVGNAARGTPRVLKPARVSKVGRKYLTVVTDDDYPSSLDFCIDDCWREKSDFSCCYELYTSEQEYADVRAARDIVDGLYRVARNLRYDSIPVEDLRKIWALIPERLKEMR